MKSEVEVQPFNEIVTGPDGAQWVRADVEIRWHHESGALNIVRVRVTVPLADERCVRAAATQQARENVRLAAEMLPFLNV